MTKTIKIILLAAVMIFALQPSIYAAVDTTSGASEAAPAPSSPTTQPTQPNQTTQDQPESTVDADQVISALEASASIMPDSSLYPIKVILEQLLADLSYDSLSKAELLTKLAERRAQESEYMHSAGADESAINLVNDALDLLSESNELLVSADKTDQQSLANALNTTYETGNQLLSLLSLISNALNEDLEDTANAIHEEIVKAIVIDAANRVGDLSYDSDEAFAFAWAEYTAALTRGDADPVIASLSALVSSGLLEEEPVVVSSTPSRYYHDDDDDDHYEHEDEHEYEHEDDD